MCITLDFPPYSDMVETISYCTAKCLSETTESVFNFCLLMGFDFSVTFYQVLKMLFFFSLLEEQFRQRFNHYLLTTMTAPFCAGVNLSCSVTETFWGVQHYLKSLVEIGANKQQINTNNDNLKAICLSNASKFTLKA